MDSGNMYGSDCCCCQDVPSFFGASFPSEHQLFHSQNYSGVIAFISPSIVCQMDSALAAQANKRPSAPKPNLPIPRKFVCDTTGRQPSKLNQSQLLYVHGVGGGGGGGGFPFAPWVWDWTCMPAHTPQVLPYPTFPILPIIGSGGTLCVYSPGMTSHTQ